jgi:nitrite reductase/ring-hydroxylating ferredoxin subunit
MPESPVYHQSWYAVARTDEVPPGALVGKDFLGTRIMLWRDGAGALRVQSAFCPHLGADLSLGELVDGCVRCPYHHWSYDSDGVCANIPTGDKIPPGARLFTYPSAEAWGLIWAFNGPAPLFEVPGIPDADESSLAYESHLRGLRPRPPWIAVSNGVDFQHLRALHGIPGAATPEVLEVSEYALEFAVDTPFYQQHGRITGTNTFAQRLRIAGEDQFMLFTGTPISPEATVGHYVIGVPAAADGREARLAGLHAFVQKLFGEDALVLDTIRFRKGTLVASDRHLARFLHFVETFPAAAPPAA